MIVRGEAVELRHNAVDQRTISKLIFAPCWATMPCPRWPYSGGRRFNGEFPAPCAASRG